MGRILARSVKFVDFQIKKDSNLVRCVKRLYPMMYDKRNLPFLNRKVQRRIIWEYIAKSLQSTAESYIAKECEERWMTLLDIYEKCKNGTSVIIMHDVLIEQLDEFLDSEPDDITYGILMEELFSYDPSQISEASEETTESSPSDFPSVNDSEDGFDLEKYFSGLLKNEACALSKLFKGI